MENFVDSVGGRRKKADFFSSAEFGIFFQCLSVLLNISVLYLYVLLDISPCICQSCSISLSLCISATYIHAYLHVGVTFYSSLSFSDHIKNLTRSCYYHLRRLKAIRRSASSLVFTSIVHVFICSRIDYCNFLFVGLPKVLLSPLQSVLNAAARLIARLPRFSHISTFIFEQLHWLPLTARIQLKVLLLVCRFYLGLAPKYLCVSL